jgi:hypothetical protein
MRKLEKEYQHYQNNKMELDEMVITAAKGAGLKPDLISLRDISLDTTADRYNQLCIYRELLGENMTHDMDVFYPVGSEYFCNETSGIKNILCYIGIFNDFSDDHYYFSYIDLSSGETIYRHEETLLNVNTNELKKYFREDFQVLTK